MKILVACECSQRVASAFRSKGHEAYSCDIEPSYGGYPEWHMETMHLPKEERSRVRSQTFLGVAAAMAEQWG